MTIFPAKILLTTDGSKDAELAATTAVALAEVTGSELHVVTVAEEYPHYDAYRPLAKRSRELARELLDGQVKKLENLGATIAQSHLRTGSAVEEVVELAEKLEAGLVVMGSRGRSKIGRLLMGSVSDSVVRHAHCPVMVVRWKPVTFPARILLATDGSKEAELAASTAADLAKGTGSELHLVTVALEYPYVYAYYDVRHPAEVERHRQEAQKILDQQVDRVVEAGGSGAKAHVSMGVPDEEIVVLAEELGADLVVVGSRGLGGMHRTLMGSVSDSVVRHAHCPVLVVRHEDGEVT
jgi:nucleotide-binding universal stress UspA family protein